MAQENVFRNAYLSDLRTGVKTGEAIANYYQPRQKYDEDSLFPLAAELVGDRPTLTPTREADVDNACLLHTYLQNLNGAQASDKRLWAYLAHASFRDYVQKRWLLPYPLEECDTRDKEKRVGDNILQHWFVEGNDSRALKRHALARLWWAAHLTVAPWDRNPQLATLKTEDRYKYTRLLLKSETLFTEATERTLGMSDIILIPLLEFVEENPKFLPRTLLRPLVKEVNLASGIKRLPLLSYEDMHNLIEEIARDLKPEATAT